MKTNTEITNTEKNITRLTFENLCFTDKKEGLFFDWYLNHEFNPGIYEIISKDERELDVINKILSAYISPSFGEYKINDFSIEVKDERNITRLRRQFLSLSYNFENINENETVANNLKVPLIIQNKSARDIKAETNDILEKFNLHDLSNIKAENLTYEQKVLLSVCISIVRKVDILVITQDLKKVGEENLSNLYLVLDEYVKTGKIILFLNTESFIPVDAKQKIYLKAQARVKSENATKITKENIFENSRKINLTSYIRVFYYWLFKEKWWSLSLIFILFLVSVFLFFITNFISTSVQWFNNSSADQTLINKYETISSVIKYTSFILVPIISGIISLTFSNLIKQSKKTIFISLGFGISKRNIQLLYLFNIIVLTLVSTVLGLIFFVISITIYDRVASIKVTLDPWFTVSIILSLIFVNVLFSLLPISRIGKFKR